jgi:DNA-binding PadR family transcriptional regulator
MDRQLLLLGLLRRQEMHGYQLNEFIEQKMHFCIDLKKPTAYYLLDKLAQKGLVREEQVQEGNRPPRRVYHITAQGEAHFFKLLRENLAEHTPTTYPTDVGIAFMDQLPPEEVATYLGQKREKVAAELERLQNATGHSGPLQHVLDHNRRLLREELEWLDDLLKNTDRS